MNAKNQLIPKESKQFIKKLFEDLQKKTEDLAVNKSITNEVIQPPIKSSTSTQVKQQYELYNKIRINLVQHQLKNQGQKIDIQGFKNLVKKKQKIGIKNCMVKNLKINQQFAQFLTQQLVIGIECKQTIKQVGTEVFKMQSPMTGQCKQFIQRAKSVATSKQACLRHDEVSDIFRNIHEKHFDLAEGQVKNAIFNQNHQRAILKYIDQQQNLNNSIRKLQKILIETYFKYRSNDQYVRLSEEPGKSLDYLTSEVESRSKMMANFIEQLEKIDYIKSCIKQSKNLVEKLDNMINCVKNVDDELKKLQKVKSSYEELNKIQQQHLTIINRVKTNVRKKPIDLKTGLQKELVKFEQKIKKHLQEKCSLDEDNKYLNTQVNCKFNGKLQQEQLIKNFQQRVSSLEQSLKARSTELLQSESQLKLLKNTQQTIQTQNKQSLHQTTISPTQSDSLTLKMEEYKLKLNKIESQMEVKDRQLDRLKTNINQLERSLSAIKQQNKRLENKVSQAQKAKIQIYYDYSQLKEQCEVLQSSQQQFETQKNRLLEQIKQLQDTIKTKASKAIEQQHQSPPSQSQEQKHHRSLLTSIVDVQPSQSNQLKAAIAENQQFKKKLQDLQTNNFRLMNQLQQERVQKQQLQKVDIQNKDAIQQLYSKVSALSNQYHHTQTVSSHAKEQYEIALNKAKKQAIQHYDLLKSKQEELQSLKNNFQALRTQLQQQINHISSIHSQEIAQLKDQLSHIETERQTIRTQLETAEANQRDLSEKILKAQNRILELSMELQAYKKSYASDSEQIQSDSNQQLQLLNQKIEEQAIQIRQRQKQIIQANYKIAKLQQTLVEEEANFKQKQHQIAKLTTDLSIQRQNKKHYQTDNARLISQISEKTSTVQYKISQIQNLTSLLRTEEVQRDSLKQEIRVKEQQAQKWQQKAKQFQKQLQNKKRDLEKQRKDLSKLKQAAQQEKNLMEQQNNLFKIRTENLQNKIREQESKNNQLQVQKENIQKIQKELEIKINTLQNQVRQLLNQKEKLQLRIQNIQTNNQDLSRRIEHLTDDNNSLARSIQAKKQQLNQTSLQLTAKQQQIKDLKESKNLTCSQLDGLPENTYLYYQQAAEKLKTGMIDLLLTDRLLQGEMMKKKVQYKHFIVKQLQKFEGKQIIQTKLIYKFDRNIYNFACDQRHRAKVDFHDYIDGTTHMLVIVKSIKGNFLAGYNEGEYLNIPITTRGLLISLSRNQVFELYGPVPNRRVQSRAMLYDAFNLNFGNSELRMKWTDPNRQELFSNFGINNGYYNNRGFRVDTLLGEGEKRETQFEDFEIYKVIYGEEQLQKRQEIREVVLRSSIR